MPDHPKNIRLVFINSGRFFFSFSSPFFSCSLDWVTGRELPARVTIFEDDVMPFFQLFFKSIHYPFKWTVKKVFFRSKRIKKWRKDENKIPFFLVHTRTTALLHFFSGAFFYYKKDEYKINGKKNICSDE